MGNSKIGLQFIVLVVALVLGGAARACDKEAAKKLLKKL